MRANASRKMRGCAALIFQDLLTELAPSRRRIADGRLLGLQRAGPSAPLDEVKLFTCLKLLYCWKYWLSRGKSDAQRRHSCPPTRATTPPVVAVAAATSRAGDPGHPQSNDVGYPGRAVLTTVHAGDVANQRAPGTARCPDRGRAVGLPVNRGLPEQDRGLEARTQERVYAKRSPSRWEEKRSTDGSSLAMFGMTRNGRAFLRVRMGHVSGVTPLRRHERMIVGDRASGGSWQVWSMIEAPSGMTRVAR